MRSNSFSILVHSVEFRRDLRLEAEAGLFEPSFSTRHVPQQCMKALWAQYQQCEHEYEQDFSTQTHDSPLVFGLVVGEGGCDVGRLFLVSLHGSLEATDAFPESFAQLGKLFRSEYQQRNPENNQQVHRLK
jgi:hypothetical protein